MGLWETVRGADAAEAQQPRRAVPGAERGDHAADGAGLRAHRFRLGLLPLGRGRGLRADPGRRRRPHPRRRRGARGDASPRTTSASPGSSSPGTATDMAGLCTDLHAVNTTLELNGFAGGLLCSMVPFATASGQRFGLTYLYKQGTFYPFAPSGEQSRDTLLELSVRDHLAAELPDGAGPAALAGRVEGARPVSDEVRDQQRERVLATYDVLDGPRAPRARTRWSSSPRRSRACRSPRSTCSAPTPSTRSPRPGSRGRTRRSRLDVPARGGDRAVRSCSRTPRRTPRFADNPWTTGEVAHMKLLRLPPVADARRGGDRHAVRLRRRRPPGDPRGRRGLAQLADRVVDVLELELASRGSARPTPASARPTTGWPTSPARSATTSRTRSPRSRCRWSRSSSTSPSPTRPTPSPGPGGGRADERAHRQPAGVRDAGSAPGRGARSTWAPSWLSRSTTSRPPGARVRPRRGAPDGARRRGPAALGADEPPRQRGQVHRRRRAARDRGRRPPGRRAPPDRGARPRARRPGGARERVFAPLARLDKSVQRRRHRPRDLPADRRGARRLDRASTPRGWRLGVLVRAPGRRPASLAEPRAAGPASSAARRRRCRSRCRRARR